MLTFSVYALVGADEQSTRGAKRPRRPRWGVAERSESFKIMIASGNHTEIKKLDFLPIGTSEPIGKKD